MSEIIIEYKKSVTGYVTLSFIFYALELKL
jgi:hypothetical protein